MKNSLIALALAGASLAPVAAVAQDLPPQVAAALSVGAMVYGPQGGEVGTIESIDGPNIVLDTGAHKATLPASALGKNDKGLLISMTKQQLDSAVAAAQAQASSTLDAALVAGAPVKTSDGMMAGTITKLEGDKITLELPGGKAIVLPKDFMMADASGLKIKMDNAGFQTAVAQATADTSAEASAADESGDEAATAATGAQ